jgi:hypothetical protein
MPMLTVRVQVLSSHSVAALTGTVSAVVCVYVHAGPGAGFYVP